MKLPSGECQAELGNDLVPSGNKPLTESLFTKIHDAIWRHQATQAVSINGDNIPRSYHHPPYPETYNEDSYFAVIFDTT